ncbi:bcl2-associated agonist of cell death-like [Hypanus sabinus]|uniref:bcl2-associated agonist of cell death-like n=1 Tax=Hypanus sabinus TaxID=79690 RepID=UPI0028C4EBA6|nr:bcl2-associated agonist of cell death-like [Hypanus sabinus]
MAKRFQIAEYPSDPFPEEAGDRGRQPGDSDSDVFRDGVSQPRKLSLPEVEATSFRSRTRSEPANFTCALQYGRELRRMSDEFVSTFAERKRLRLSRSAGAIVSQVYQRVTTYFPQSRKAGGGS